MKYVLWQQAHSPTSIMGSIEAPTLVAAADLAREMYGSFYIVEWPRASAEHRAEAERMDLLADVRADEVHV